MTKRMHSVISVLVAFAMVLFMGLSTLGISAGAVTQSEIDALAKKKKDLQSQQAQLQQTINNLRGQQADAYALKEQLDKEVEVIYQKIQVTQQEIQLYQTKIEEETAELQKQEILRQEQEQKLKVRMRAMEENGRYGYLEVLMTAESLSDLLSKLDDVEQIMTNDKDLENGYKAAVEQCSKIKAELEDEEKALKNFESELESQQNEMQKQIETASATIASLQGDIDEYLTEYDETAANLQEVTDDISSLEAQRAAAARAAAAAKAAACHRGPRMFPSPMLQHPPEPPACSSGPPRCVPSPVPTVTGIIPFPERINSTPVWISAPPTEARSMRRQPEPPRSPMTPADSETT